MRPKLGGVLETALYVEDVEASARFYQELFGFERIEGDHRLVALSVLGRQVLLLIRKGSSAGPHQSSGGVIPGSDSSGTSHLTFKIDASDFDAWEKWLGENGVAIESKVPWERGGRSLYFRDPDNHLLELATPGTWAIY
ncbi:MAG: VOC family protein [Acidobacteria bacterium]|nr:VOC family protein [Acidobacteriota bacterium]